MTTTKAQKTKSAGQKSDRIRVVFHSQEGPGGDDDIFVAVNGRAYLIKREHEVNLPAEALEVLKNARQTVFEQSERGVVERDIQRFGYSERSAAHEG